MRCTTLSWAPISYKFQSPGWGEFSTGETSLGLHPASEKNPAGSIELGFNACLRRNRILEEVLLNSSTQKVDVAALPSERQTLPISKALRENRTFLFNRLKPWQSIA